MLDGKLDNITKVILVYHDKYDNSSSYTRHNIYGELQRIKNAGVIELTI